MTLPLAELRSRTLRGLAWKTASQSSIQLMRIASGIVLARLLTPEDYGLAAMALVFSALTMIFTDLALGAALIQRRTITQADRSTVFWTSAAAGLVFTVAGVAAAGPVASFYGEPSVEPLFVVLSLSFMVNALGATQAALLTRDLQFRSLEMRGMAATALSVVVAIGLAGAGYGPWAIIGQQLAFACLSTALMWAASPWRPNLRFSTQSLRRLGGFSAQVFLSRTLFYANRNADNLLVGRFLGSASLGVYALAYNVMLLPLLRIAGPITNVMFPAFARLQDDVPALASVWLRANRMIAAAAMPALAGLIVVAPDFVPVVLGEQWRPAVPVIQLLAVVGLLQSVQRLNSSLLQARDRAATLLRFSALSFALNTAAVAVGLAWGVVGVAASLVVVNVLIQPFYAALTAKVLETTFRAYLSSLSGVTTATAIMVAVVLGSRLLLVDTGVPAAVRLAVAVLAGAIVFVPACAWRAPEVKAEILRVARRNSQPAPARAAA